MAAKKKSKTKSKGKAQRTQEEESEAAQATSSNGPAHKSSASKAIKGEDLIDVSPSRVRFQHSKIRPYFSGCGRSVMDTLNEIREGKLEPGDLPPIQVLIGPDDGDGEGPWYFSLNNRRLWVLKRCHQEGLLDNERYNNKISVRVRMPKSGAEAERYSVENCALEAKFMREGSAGGGKSKKKKGKVKKSALQSEEDDDEQPTESCSKPNSSDDDSIDDVIDAGVNGVKIESDSDSESESDDDVAHQNPFSALL